MNIVQAIKDRRLFGSLFADLSSWSAWLVFLKATFGIEMDEKELNLYRHCTKRSHPPRHGAKEAWAVVGRRGGKSRIIAIAGSFIASFYKFENLAPGERGMVLNLARDREQGKIVFSYISAILTAIPALQQMITRQTSDEIELTNGITIAVKTSDYRAVRGVTIVCCIADEIAFWDAIGANPDTAILQAIRPAMATIAEAKLLVISSPYAKFGALYEAYKRYYGQEHPHILIWQAETRVMNPTISQQFINEEIERDPDAARSEWFAQFREDVEAAFSIESIEACVIPGRSDLLPAQHITYRAFVDPSGGRHDQFTCAVAHRSGENAIIDLVRAWAPPFDPSVIAKECSEVLKPYRIRNIVGDNYGGEWPKEQFRKHDIVYEVSEKHRSQLYLNLIPALNSKRIELPDHRKLIDELRRLERRRGRSGKDTVDHPAYGGSDDIANSVAGAVDLVITKPQLSKYAVPMGVGRGIGADLRRSVGPLAMDKPLNGGLPPEEERLRKGGSWRYRLYFGSED
jgi:hypothetical protein